MKIYKSEIKPMIDIISKNHGIPKSQAQALIHEYNNGMAVVVNNKVRQRKTQSKKDRTKNFVKEFREIKKRKSKDI